MRTFAGLPFDHVAEIEPERDASRAICEFMPQPRYANERGLSLNPYGAGPFCRFTAGRGIRLPGVYVVCVQDRPVYVGKCSDLSERWGPRNYGAISPRNCFTPGGQSTNCKVNSRILSARKAGERVDLYFHQTKEIDSVESCLVRELAPIWNDRVPW